MLSPFLPNDVLPLLKRCFPIWSDTASQPLPSYNFPFNRPSAISSSPSSPPLPVPPPPLLTLPKFHTLAQTRSPEAAALALTLTPSSALRTRLTISSEWMTRNRIHCSNSNTSANTFAWLTRGSSPGSTWRAFRFSGYSGGRGGRRG